MSEALQEEFGDDLLKWPGSLNMGTLSIRFKNPFAQGEAEVPNSFKHVLRDFFPRYIKILTKPEYKDEIAEIRIEGHTSSEWRVGGEDLAYYYNMELSQDRARKVLEYVLEITDSRIKDHKEWIKEYLTANGLSSSKLIPNEDETPNQEASRRVEFRVVTKSEELITELEALIETFNDLIRSGN